MLHAEDNAPHNQTLYCIVWTILSLTRGVGTPAPLSLTPGVGGWAGHCGVSKINQPSAESKKLKGLWSFLKRQSGKINLKLNIIDEDFVKRIKS